MGKERRKGEWPIPDILEDVLTEMQLIALREIEAFGWKLRFVRKPRFQAAVPVVFRGEGDQMAVLDKNGKINLQPSIEFRA